MKKIKKARERVVNFDRLKLIDAQARAGLSCTELAEKLDVDRSYISHWRSGANEPATKYRIALCKIFKVDMAFWNPEISS